MFAVVDVAVLVLFVALVRIGWKRGFAYIVLDLVGLAVAIALTVRFFPLLASLFRRLGAPDGWADFAAVVSVFGPAIAIVAVVGMRLSRFTWLPGLHLVNRLAGVAFGAALAVAIAITALLALQLAPVPRFVTDPIGRSTAARVVLTAAPPALRALEAVASDHADGYLIHLRWSVAWVGADPLDEAVTYPKTVRGAHVRDVEADILRRVNETRASDGRPRVASDAELASSARVAASRAGPDGRLVGEIQGERATIVTLAPTTRLAFDGIMRTRAVRDVVLDAASIGIGAYDTPKGLVVAVVSCDGC